MFLRSATAVTSGSSSRILVVLRWPWGLLRVSWRYLWRTTPVHRSEQPGGPEDLPPMLPADVLDDEVQTPADGVGPLLRRRYTVRAAGARATPEEILRMLRAEPNWGTPGDMAVFVKMCGEPGRMLAGDEYVVRMPGPWNGPVRVVDSSPTSFRLVTLRGHLEAGQIEFRAAAETDGVCFEIESWARPGDRLSNLLYNRLPLAKEIQLNLWLETCLQVVARSGGRLRGGVQVHTRRVDDPVPDRRGVS